MPKAIVLGGYGLIGLACMRRLAKVGYEVAGIGRSERSAFAADPSGDWIIRDIPAISTEEWSGLLSGVDVLVNASGALQDGVGDDLEAIHVTTLSRLTLAARDMPVRVVQISAASVSEDAPTAFMRTKAQGDRILASQMTNWVILRPTLVIAQEAYGGTALLRAVAALPVVQPRVLPKAKIQTVYIGDVASAVVAAAKGDVPAGTIADLTEEGTHRFEELVAKLRLWQGWAPPAFRPALPAHLVSLVGKGADLLGYFGWRSPLRSTALTVLKDGIRGDPGVWKSEAGWSCRSLEETLALVPATRQERVFARAYFAMPLAIATLAVFWCLSGIITLVDPARAMAVLSERAVPSWVIAPTVFGGAVGDLALGLAIVRRAWTKRAALGMVGLSGVYLLGSFLVAPDLWADPLGPMVKVVPGMVLAIVVWLLMEER